MKDQFPSRFRRPDERYLKHPVDLLATSAKHPRRNGLLYDPMILLDKCDVELHRILYRDLCHPQFPVARDLMPQVIHSISDEGGHVRRVH
jgi:hypothetical protein